MDAIDTTIHGLQTTRDEVKSLLDRLQDDCDHDELSQAVYELTDLLDTTLIHLIALFNDEEFTGAIA